jgi:putative membrane protein
MLALLEVRDMMYGWDAAGLGGWWMLAGMAILAFAVLGSVWLIVHRPGVGGPSRSPAEEILRERFARGELNDDQFDEAKRRLG